LQDKVSIDDFLQDTFIKGMVSIQNGGYQNTGSLAGWLYTIGHNMIISHHIRNERYHLKLIPSNDAGSEQKSFFEPFVGSELSPEDERIAHEFAYETADIMELLDDLPHEQKEVLMLRYYHNLKFNEIVTYLGLDENSEQGDRISTPRVRALLAIKKLQGMVQKRKINTG
jgi:RNA polymerase sigma-70 factor (ECF subfamily)